MSAPTLEFQPCAAEPLLPARATPGAVIAVVIIWALSMLIFPAAAIGTLALLGAAAMVWLARLAYRRPEWLIFALLLVVEILPSANFLPVTEAQRPLLRYPLYLLFCAPVLPRVWRSGILSQGGFRLYTIYFVWAFLSATYSLSPVFSLGRAFSSSLLFVAICSVALDVDNGDEFQVVLRDVLMACAVVTAILVFVAIVPSVHSAWFLDDELGRERFQGMFESPNQVGEVNMITIGAALACWNSLRGAAWKIALAVLIAVSVCLLVVADSRSAAVAMIIGMAVVTIWRYRWRGVAATVVAGAVILFATSQLSPQALLYITRHDVSTLTGRTEVMHFSLNKLTQSPLVGYGFGVEGQIFQDKYFPFWDDLWTLGPRIPIHNGYLSRAVGLGIPAALLWVFLFGRPFVALFAGRDDPYGLKKPVVLLVVLPVLILYLSETLGGDCRYPAGLVSTLVWAVAERQRLRVKAAHASARTEAAALGLTGVS
jgi:O-Antigen ligase